MTQLLLAAPKQPIALLAAPRTVHVASIGGGGSSTFKLVERMIQQFGKENCKFIFAYLPNEHPDVLQLVFDVERRFGIDVKFIGLNRTPMEQFFKEHFLGNGKTDPCSKNLKRLVVLHELEAHYDKRFTELHVGVTYGEVERMIRIKHHWNKSGWQVTAPLANDPTITRDSLIRDLEAAFGWIPEMYRLGFEHHNCHGACVKAGQKQWAMVLYHYPAVYAEWEAGKKTFQANYGPYTILSETRQGVKRPLSLETLRLRLQLRWANMLPGFDPFDGLEENPACFFCAAV